MKKIYDGVSVVRHIANDGEEETYTLWKYNGLTIGQIEDSGLVNLEVKIHEGSTEEVILTLNQLKFLEKHMSGIVAYMEANSIGEWNAEDDQL